MRLFQLIISISKMKLRSQQAIWQQNCGSCCQRRVVRRKSCILVDRSLECTLLSQISDSETVYEIVNDSAYLHYQWEKPSTRLVKIKYCKNNNFPVNIGCNVDSHHIGAAPRHIYILKSNPILKIPEPLRNPRRTN